MRARRRNPGDGRRDAARALLLVVPLLAIPAARAGEGDAEEHTSAAARTDAPVHEVRLRSGSVLVGRLEPELWHVTTRFGKLAIPVAKIESVRFGRRSDPERSRLVSTWIERLVSANPEERGEAAAALQANAAFAIAELQHAAKEHDDPELRRRCAELLEKIDVPEEEVVPELDRVETTEFTFTGTIDLASIKVTVPELGGLGVARRDVVGIARQGSVQIVEVTVTGTHMWPNGWLDTKLRYEKGQRIRLSAEGTIQFPNWGGQTFTPDGNPHMGNINGMPMGCLAGRIDGGAIFLVGSDYDGKAPATGTLQLCLALNVRGQPSNGEYTVKIHRDD